jgi:putative FmdB family regulatory protein
MPIYAYGCEACGHAFDVMQKISEPLLTDCPQCHRPALKKQLSAPGFQLKGGGWYATDFKGKKSSSSGSGSEAGSGSGGDTGTSSDTPKKAHGCGAGGCGCN